MLAVKTAELAELLNRWYGFLLICRGEATFALPLAGVVDIAAERSRLEGEIDKIGREIDKIDAKLGNEQFLAKAPDHIVATQRARREEAVALRDKTAAALARISG